MVRLTAVATFSTEIVHNVSVTSIGRYPATEEEHRLPGLALTEGHPLKHLTRYQSGDTV
jgi:hypothetical protein